MPTYKIAGKIQKVEYDTSNTATFKLFLAPDGDYSLKNDDKHYALMLLVDNETVETLALEYAKTVTFEFTLPNGLILETGKHVELGLEIVKDGSDKIILTSDLQGAKFSHTLVLKTISLLA